MAYLLFRGNKNIGECVKLASDVFLVKFYNSYLTQTFTSKDLKTRGLKIKESLCTI